MAVDVDLYHSCVEPEFTHSVTTANASFPPLIALTNVPTATVDAVERQVGVNWSSYPPNIKESLVLEDVLNILCGSEGTLFSIESYKVKCSSIIDRKNDATLYMMAKEILELAIMQRRVQEFVKNNERGFVSLSFCEVLNVLLQELQSRIAQFDASHRKAGFSLQRFKLYVQPALHTFEVLTMIASQGQMTGTALINVLSSVNQMFGTGDARHSLANHLVKQAMESYCYLIDPWIHYGELYDPCQEFFVVPKRTDVSRPDARDFYIEWVRVPDLIKDIAETIMDTGTYVKILSKSKRKVPVEPRNLQFTSIDELKERVIGTHEAVSEELMKYIIFECNLMDVLESVHRFFLMARGDYISILLADVTHDELYDALNFRFHEAVAQSSLRHDEYSHLYCLDVDNEQRDDENSTKTGVDRLTAVNLTIRVDWPLQIFFNDHVMGKYQMVFKFLLRLKQTVHSLSKIWINHMKWKRLPLAPSAQLRLNYTFVSLERMLFLCRNIEYLCTFEVAERNFNLMLQTYENYVKTSKGQQPFNSIAKEHEKFISQVIDQCMLENKNVSPLMQRAVAICSVFSVQVLEFLEQWETESGYSGKVGSTQKSGLDVATKFTSELLQNHGYIAMVGTASRQFENHMSALVVALEGNEAHHASSLYLRLTFNGFFK